MSQQIQTIAAEIFQVSAEAINFEMTPDDVERWDSLNHLRLITAIEAEYGARFSMSQIQSIESLSDIRSLVAQVTDQQ